MYTYIFALYLFISRNKNAKTCPRVKSFSFITSRRRGVFGYLCGCVVIRVGDFDTRNSFRVCVVQSLWFDLSGDLASIIKSTHLTPINIYSKPLTLYSLALSLPVLSSQLCGVCGVFVVSLFFVCLFHCVDTCVYVSRVSFCILQRIDRPHFRVYVVIKCVSHI